MRTNPFSSRLNLPRTGWLIAALAVMSSSIYILPQLIDLIGSKHFLSLLPPDNVQPGLSALGISLEIYSLINFTRFLILVLLFISVGAVIFWKKSDEPVVLYFSILLISMGVLIALDILPPPGQLSPWLALATNLPFAAFFSSFYIFPDGRFVPRWTRWMTHLWLIAVVSISFFPGSLLDPNSWSPWVSLPFYLVLFGSLPLAQIHRYRRVSSPIQRQQTKWVVFSMFVAVSGFMAFWLPLNLIPSLDQPGITLALYDLIGGTALIGAYAFIPVSIGLALLRNRLWDIDPLINRTLVYATLTAITITLYAVLVGFLGTLIQARDKSVFAFLATGVVAVLFQPLRDRLQRTVNRLMYGESDDPYAVISRLGQRLEATLTPDAVLPTFVQTVKEALRLPYVAIALQHDHDKVLVAESGTLSEKVFKLPLTYQNQPVGEFVLASRSPDETFSPGELRLLEDLARQGGIAAHAVSLTNEVQRARERLVAGREEERRRLRRDLHDGLGPHLASQMLTISAARQLLHQDPQAADALLAEAINHAKSAVSDIRRVVYELRPPALDDLGLVGALRAQAKEYAQSAVEINILAPAIVPALPAAIEVACYHIAREALTNVIHHANARNCHVILSINKNLHLDVLDDGCGLPSDIKPGVGFYSMRERAEEVGGRCLVKSAPGGGTQVALELPLVSEP